MNVVVAAEKSRDLEHNVLETIVLQLMVIESNLPTGFTRNTKEQKRELKLGQLCSGALLGTGLV